MISFGPIPSRRLGKSLGINNISCVKTCTYSCIYCQLGRTRNIFINKRSFYEPQVLLSHVKTHIEHLDAEHKPDYLTIIPNGEPTLDVNLEEEIKLLKTLHYPIAVITNGSLLFDKNTRHALKKADLVSVKVDSFHEETWIRINRPSKQLDFQLYLEGVKTFVNSYKGELFTETMLVKDVNDSEINVNLTAYFISKLKPKTSYLLTPTRPPSESLVSSPAISDLYCIKNTFERYGLKTKLLIEFEGNDIGITGNTYEDILDISSVHPIREDVLLKILKDNHADEYVLYSLISEELIKPVCYQGKTYYMRNYHV